MTDNTGNDVLLKVSSSSAVSNLAAAIANNVYAEKDITLRAIGAAAVNQTMKAIAAAQAFVGPRGLTLLCRPAFTTVGMPDKSVSALIVKIIVTK